MGNFTGRCCPTLGRFTTFPDGLVVVVPTLPSMIGCLDPLGLFGVFNAAVALRSLSAFINGDLQPDPAVFCGAFGK